MSIKIINTYQISKEEVLNLLPVLEEKLKENATRIISEQYMNLMFEHNFNKTLYSYEEIVKNQIEEFERNYHTLYPDYKANLYYLNQGIIVFICDESSQTEIYHNLFSNFDDFDFWNHTDNPNNISDDVWLERKNTWKAILNDFKSSFNEVGECLLNFRYIPSEAEALSFVNRESLLKVIKRNITFSFLEQYFSGDTVSELLDFKKQLSSDIEWQRKIEAASMAILEKANI